ncbi:phosphatidylglycerol lysyltransferase domain-containing protein [Tropicimonas sp. IMCC34011]|uniref:phosphatidylglycerol lysyltransferase domain-containing protein n=1 Tax=Tropicimonas sp. IMCC34011 TaxID=2248759 RepID=UPI000E265221|nr:phosphatidylglycerol lysyltransferase domain-containing protein [Tropicimonas sp. IMCC34011]
MNDPAQRGGAVIEGLRQAGQAGLVRHALPFVAALLCAALLAGRVREMDWSEVAASLAATPPERWIIAALFTAFSFWAVGRYDAVLHGLLGTGVDRRRASAAGMIAIAGSQSIGFGLISGTLLRWRLLPEISIWQAARLTALVGISFLAGWAVVASALLTLLPPTPMFHAAGLAGLGLGALALCYSVAAPWFHRPAPPVMAIGALLLFVALDTLAAGLALHVLLPAGTVPLAALLPAFLVAFGVGLLSGAPGGIGPFEVLLLALLPAAPEATLVAGIIAFRAVYYALPACIGLAALLVMRPSAPAPAPCRRAAAEAALARAPRAEARLAGHGGARYSAFETGGATLFRTAHCEIALFDPCGETSPDELLTALTAEARSALRIPAIYKCGGRLAAAARRRGWTILPIAEEMTVDPATHDPASPGLRQLRRKLRRASRAGLSVTRAGPVLPAEEMALVAASWAAARGGERGFSVGRYCPDHIARQAVFLARLNGTLVAFATFHVTEAEMALDLMRFEPDAPEGCMHALVQAAIEEAASRALPRLSLAALPPREDRRRRSAASNLLARSLRRRSTGLAQFKTSFAPTSRPLYMAAPGPFALSVAGAEVLREIHRPPRLPIRAADHAQASPAPLLSSIAKPRAA